MQKAAGSKLEYFTWTATKEKGAKTAPVKSTKHDQEAESWVQIHDMEADISRTAGGVGVGVGVGWWGGGG